MDSALGLIAFVVFLVCVVAVAAGLTWIVVKLSPTRKPEEPPAS
jgi:hypothetical protein